MTRGFVHLLVLAHCPSSLCWCHPSHRLLAPLFQQVGMAGYRTHKVPPTSLQAMHRASAELGQALKSPEKATVAPEGDWLHGSHWSLFPTWISGRGSGFCSSAGEGAGRDEAWPSNYYHARLGAKQLAKEVTTSKHTKSTLGSACCSLLGCLVPDVHSGPNGLRACICPNNNRTLHK